MEEATGSFTRAVERAYRGHADRLWRSLLLFAGDPEIASDAVAEAFAQALRRGDAIRDIDAWVWRAAVRIARGELARRRAGPRELPQDLRADLTEPGVDLVRALRRLSPKQRGVVVLRLYAGYSAGEAGSILGISATAVGTHLNRARARLRKLLEDVDDE